MTETAPKMPRRSRDVAAANRRALSAGYATGMLSAYLIAAVEVTVVGGALARASSGAVSVLTSPTNLVVIAVLVVGGSVAAAIGGYLNIAPTLRWYVGCLRPDKDQQLAAANVVRRQFVVLATTWGASGAALVAFNHRAGPTTAVVIVLLVCFGSTASAAMSLLFAQRILRPIVAAIEDVEWHQAFPGVVPRLFLLWVLVGVLPSVATVTLIVCRVQGWGIAESSSVEAPLAVIAVVALLVGAPALALVTRSISEPVGEVVDAMAHVKRGEMERRVAVYEKSEIGRLQAGFNQMVTGLSERDRLRDLFDRHVGTAVARLALDTGSSLDGQVVDVAVLFVDLVDSTALAAERAPEDVAEVLNAFFRIVVAEVDDEQGLVNKFEGDAVLAVFGAPTEIDDPAGHALAAARRLGGRLRGLDDLDFGLGISAGPVFAGKIGAEKRYEYTVVGDAVNEAARLADIAKHAPARTLCTSTVLGMAGGAERELWQDYGTQRLRGRSTATHMLAPRLTHK